MNIRKIIEGGAAFVVTVAIGLGVATLIHHNDTDPVARCLTANRAAAEKVLATAPDAYTAIDWDALANSTSQACTDLTPEQQQIIIQRLDAEYRSRMIDWALEGTV